MAVCSVVLISLYSLCYRAEIKDHSLLPKCVLPFRYSFTMDFSHLISQIAIHPILLFYPSVYNLLVVYTIKSLQGMGMNTFNSKHENLICP